MARKVAHIAYRSARNLDRTIQAMLDYGKLKVQENITFKSVDMNLVVEQAVLNLQQVIADRQVKINWNQLPTVQGNEQLLIQLTSNLIKNAIVHNPSDSLETNISARWQSQRWELCVTDNGSGISASNQKKIFALFERADSSQAQGSGIGLALCRRIVELHQGIIDVRSQPNQGSTFYFDLAAAKD